MRRKCPCPMKKFANYGLPTDTSPTWCAQCPDKPAEAENIVSRKCPCAAKKCANFGLPADMQPTWCTECPDRPAAAVNVVSSRRLASWCNSIVGATSLRSYCKKCFTHLFPGDSISRNYLVKKRTI
ncbi:hypothetical protein CAUPRSCDRAFT_12189 [Caulochytrium protostelioides]|uniref:Uncharacterized protein n=1 Tax=Caulochytrium protostelioides TaxID=1555241 RepID=A0A4P9WXE4_9FUNG|nr:hypothetical protein CAUPRSCDRAFT_12189 [Caulochytrium protostelioides]